MRVPSLGWEDPLENALKGNPLQHSGDPMESICFLQISQAFSFVGELLAGAWGAPYRDTSSSPKASMQ